MNYEEEYKKYFQTKVLNDDRDKNIKVKEFEKFDLNKKQDIKLSTTSIKSIVS